MNSPAPVSRSWLWWTLLAVACWGIWALLARWIGDALSPGQQQAISTLGILPVLGMLASSRHLGPPGRNRRGALFALAAGALTCLGNLSYYEVLNRGPKAATVVPLTALYPMVTVLLAVLFLRERLRPVQRLGILLSLGAIYLFNVQEGGSFLTSWLWVALIPILLWGVAALLQKIATQELSGERTTLWFLAAFIPVAGFLLLREPVRTLPAGRTCLLVLLLGFAFALGNFALLVAYARHGKASVITPLAGLYPLVSIPLAMVLFGERLSRRETAGILLALAAVLAIAWEPDSAPDSADSPAPPFPQ